MSAKRPQIDLMALTSDQATSMPEAVQRTAPTPTPSAPLKSASPRPATGGTEQGRVPTAELVSLSFKVPPEFRRRVRQRAANADLKLNELLVAALDAWEEKQGVASTKS